MTELIAAYPYGDPLCLEVAPDGKRAFVAQGAVIEVLQTEQVGSFTPIVLQSIEVPDASPMVLRYFERDANTRQLFIAGGTHGPWRIDLCSSLFDTTPTPCADSTVNRTQIDTNLTTPPKRCVDIEIVEGHAAHVPLLFALFAANSDASKSTVGPSELRAYKLNADGTTPAWGSPFVFPSTSSPAPDNVATAMTWVPGSPNKVYVALGIDWLWEIDVTNENAITGARLGTGSLPTCLGGCTKGEQLRDVFGIHNADGDEFVYGALEYGRVLEYRLGTGVVTATTVTCMSEGVARLESISAAMEENMVFVAVGIPGETGRHAETEAPFHATGLWNDPCLGVGLADPNGSGYGPSACTELRFLKRCTETASSLSLIGHEPLTTGGYWNSLVLRRVSGWLFHAYSSTQEEGMQIHELAPVITYSGAMSSEGEMSFESEMSFGGGTPGPCGAQPLSFTAELLASYRGTTIPVAAGTTSLRDPDLSYFGHDDTVGVVSARQVYVQNSPRDLVPVPKTMSVCKSRDTAIPQISIGICPDGVGSGDPNPFIGSILGTARWLDPNDEEVEWFLPGGSLWRRANPTNCTVWGPGECSAGLCDAPLAWIREGLDLTVGATNVGWKLVKLSTANPTHTLPSGANMDLHWWQFQCPSGLIAGRAEDVPYLSSKTDPRLEYVNENDLEPVPVLLHCPRAGSDTGIKFVRPKDLMAASQGTCTNLGSGYGEGLEVNPAMDFVPYLEALTHVEFEVPGLGLEPCRVDHCAGTLFRHLFNGKCDLFTAMHSMNGQRQVVAVPAGFVATDFHILTPDCLWDDYSTRTLVVLYDVTDSPAEFSLPQAQRQGPPVLRVLLGPVNGNAFAVAAKNYPNLSGSPTYLFVANFSGSMLVYDVSPSVLFAEAPVPQGSPYLPTRTPVLAPNAEVIFGKDPYDGVRGNAVEVVVDGDYAYLCLARAGIAVVDISNPLVPVLVTVLDTPGLAQGIALRQDLNGQHQMMVGDSRAGMRLYGLPGQ